MAEVYEEIKEHFSTDGDVVVLSGRGAQGVKRGKKLFVMFLKGDLLVKLPAERVAEIVASGDGLAYDPGTGKPMRNAVLIPASRKDLWIGYAKEAKQY